MPSCLPIAIDIRIPNRAALTASLVTITTPPPASPVTMQILSTLALLAGLVAAVPTPNPQIPAAGAGTVNLLPTVYSQYAVWTGAITYNTNLGRIEKNGRQTDNTTLLSFVVTSANAGKPFSFRFALDSAATNVISGTGQFDLFSSLAPATGSATSWPPGDRRNQHLGRFQVVKGGVATAITAGFPTPTGTLPTATGTYGWELVGVGDNDIIQWVPSATNGAYINY
jgi:hypothetical protein